MTDIDVVARLSEGTPYEDDTHHLWVGNGILHKWEPVHADLVDDGGDAWRAFAVSEDGACVYFPQPDGLHISTDAGATFAKVAVVDDMCCECVCSASGRYVWLFYGSYGNIGFGLGHWLHVSDDYGATWSDVVPAGSVGETIEVSCSDSGQLALVHIGSSLWYTTDAGATWANVTPPGTPNNLSHICVSGDGAHVYLTAWLSGGRGVYRWDGDTTWTRLWDTASVSLRNIVCSDDGTVIMVERPVGATGNVLSISTDSGATWNPITPAGAGTYIFALAMSSDGQRLMLGCQGAYQDGGIYVSMDQGARWTLEYPKDVYYGKNWFVAATDDMSTLYATTREYRPLWTRPAVLGVDVVASVLSSNPAYTGTYKLDIIASRCG